MKSLLRKQAFFIIPYTIIFMTTSLVVLLYNREEIQLTLNSYHNSFWDLCFPIITKFGEAVPIVLACLLGIYLSWKHFFSFLSGYLGAGLVVILGKLWLFAEVKRPKTVMDHYEFYHWVEGVSLRSNHSFPSGHTQAAFSVFCFFSLCTQNKVLQSLCLVAAILVGYSRIYISQHFLPDVVVGSFLGVSAMLISHHLWFRSEGKPWFHRSPFRKKA